MGSKRKVPSNSPSEPELKRSRVDSSDDESDDLGRAGRIVRVNLKNFMCHSDLEIKLNENVNYIIGRNGSGKSAILTALIVGLGGRATMTNRGSSMKSFIKVGQSSAQIDITLTNTGPMAYKPRHYGKTITVTRIFSEGSSRYKLKSETGVVVSTQCRDVHKLTEALNIHVDNPICILNQDIARTFLNTNDTTKKYQMFMKATNLENIDEQYQLGLQNKRDIQMTLKAKKKSLVSLKEETDKWFEKLQALESLDELQRKKRSLMVEVMWSKVYIERDEMLAKKKEHDDVLYEVETLEGMAKNKKQQISDLNRNKEVVQNQLREVRTEFESNQRAIDSVKTNSHRIREGLFSKQKIIDSIEKVIEKKIADKKQIESDLKTIELNQQNRQKLFDERSRRLDDLQKKLQETVNVLGTTENDLTQNRSDLQRKLSNEKNISEELYNVESKISQLRAQIRSLKSESDNSVKVYGRNMPRVLSAIKNAKEQFLKMPIGPIGSSIKLKDKKWAVAIEGLIGGGLLEAYCVDNTRDSKILNGIFDTIYGMNQPRPTIISSKFFDKVHNFDVNKTHVPNGCAALIDALKISNPIVTNCLIDQLNIETILLTPTGEMAMSLMSRAENVPKNCSRSITLKGDQFYPDPAYRSYAGKLKVAHYLQVNTSELVKQYESDLQKQENNSESILQQRRAIENDIKDSRLRMKELDEKLNGLNRYKVNIKNKIEQVRLDEMPMEKNLDIYRNEMDEIDKIIEKKHFEVLQISDEMKEIEKGGNEIKNKLADLKKNAKELNERMEPLMQQIDEIQSRLNEIETSSKYKTEKLKHLKAQLDNLRTVLAALMKTYEDVKQYTSEAGEEPEVPRQLTEVISEIKQIDHSLEQAQHLIGDSDAVRNTYQRISMKYVAVKDLINNVQETFDAMSKAMHVRARQYHRLVQQIGCSVREMFSGVLRVRQFSGHIDIDHEKKTLELVVVPQHGSQNVGAKHILSGGERSYSTVAFLMSLWQVMEYPFYFLDEFDVFMDKVNRRVIMDMLLDHSLDHKNLQYVYLTPQDISNIKISDLVTIHRMEDPERKAIQNSQE